MGFTQQKHVHAAVAAAKENRKSKCTNTTCISILERTLEPELRTQNRSRRIESAKNVSDIASPHVGTRKVYTLNSQREAISLFASLCCVPGQRAFLEKKRPLSNVLRLCRLTTRENTHTHIKQRCTRASVRPQRIWNNIFVGFGQHFVAHARVRSSDAITQSIRISIMHLLPDLVCTGYDLIFKLPNYRE